MEVDFFQIFPNDEMKRKATWQEIYPHHVALLIVLKLKGKCQPCIQRVSTYPGIIKYVVLAIADWFAFVINIHQAKKSTVTQ